MTSQRSAPRRARLGARPALAVLLTAAALAAPARAQQAPAPGPAVVPAYASPGDPAAPDPGVVPAGCASCGGGLLGPGPGAADSLCPGGPTGCGGCVPGRQACDCCCDGDGKTCVHRFFCGLYNCICCPDPCYEPRWLALANSAFFADSPRPVTQIRLRGDWGWNYSLPDKAEYFWAKENAPAAPGVPTPPAGKGPTAPAGVRGESNLDYNEDTLYMEGAVGQRFSFFVELPYRQVWPQFYVPASGFADMNVGTKSVLLDCELLLLTFQFRTYIPTGAPGKGIGVGHVGLDPSLLWALKLTQSTYFQGQAGYLSPIGGTHGVMGNVIYGHFSLNQLLWQCGACNGIQLIGTAELSAYEFGGGGFTDPATGALVSARLVDDIVNIGPGLRLVICNKIDFGVGSAFSITSDRLTKELIRTEFRWRF